MTREPGPALPRRAVPLDTEATATVGVPGTEPLAGPARPSNAATTSNAPDDRTTSRAGHARALTVMTPLPRIWAPAAKLVLGFKSRQGPDPVLQRLSFIHVAHWVVIDRLPGQTRRSRYAYLLFVSNFNGSWREYIDAFSTAIPRRMAALWGTSFGFPGAQPPKPFVRYIADNQVAPAHYYAAYPEATATEVESALRVRDEFRATVESAADLDDEQFAKAWRVFVQTVQRDL